MNLSEKVSLDEIVPDVPARILVVDDNESNRDVLLRRLKRQEYSVETASDGLEALAKVRAQEFDVILLDIMMPGLDGYEVLRQIKADPKLRRIPIVVISALDEMESVVRCIEMGAEDYLPKPFSPTLLKARIAACLERKRAQDREALLFAQLKENYERLHKLEQQRDDLAHMIVHDLRSPLSANLAALEMIEMLGTLSPEQHNCVNIATRSGRNLLDLINDLLDISKLEAGALKLELRALDAFHVTVMAIEQIKPLLADKSLQLKRDFQPDLPLLSADESKLHRVFANLISNAIKFTPRGGEIIISARAQENDILFAVRDTGEGISPEAAPHIFEKFGQAEDRVAGRNNSTGLGLTFCKLAVEAHGGRIWFESTLGEGSVFSFTIPAANPATTAAEATTAETITDKTTGAA